MAIWSLVTIIGPIIFVAVLAWAIWRNKRSRVPEGVTEGAARRLRAEEEQARRDGTDGEE